MVLRPIIQVVVPAVVLAFLAISNPLAQQPEGAPSGKQKSVKSKNVKPNGVKQKSVIQDGASQNKAIQQSGEMARRTPNDTVARSMVKAAEAGAVRSDEPMARMLKVDGDVLVSTESGLVAGEQGGVLQEGARVITMANSNVTLVYSDGCSLSLKPNARIEISEALPCDERLNQVRLVVLDPSMETILEGQTASIPALALSGLLQGGAATTTGLAGLAALVGGREDSAVSPN